ncbi:MAG: alpha-N-acetylglucosaminidase N-terminal domain-containing protein, partial [Prevotella sp.]|nr:alpha-N-acetylglucosaminidase N-terminal domain-containing protein [Prevotella sp.]
MKRICLLLSLFVICSIVIANPIDGLLERIEKGTSKKIKTEIVSSSDGTDFFELDQDRDKIVIRGNNYVSIATGINWYFKY